MTGWTTPQQRLPDEGAPVEVRTAHAGARADYYRIGDYWYALEDLDRWRMNTSRYWPQDQAWRLPTRLVAAWRYAEAPG